MPNQLVDQRTNGFPLSLKVESVGEMRDYDSWASAYNKVIGLYASNPEHSQLRKDERAFLALINALDKACDQYQDPFAGEHVIRPLYQVLENASNYGAIRLDAGRGLIMEWASARVRSAGVDPETGEWIGEA